VPDARIRPATESDVDAIVGLVYELAEYEKLPQECHLTPVLLQAALFGEHPAVFGHVAEANGAVVGYTLHFLNFSTWEGVHGIYLEDLYVQPAHRGSGAGRALLAELARIATERGYARVEWSVLNWNEPAIGFYRRIGAVPMDEWTTYRLTGSALASLAR
jgi:ribosomal protein S18 acetylase RimI-like enzyme